MLLSVPVRGFVSVVVAAPVLESGLSYSCAVSALDRGVADAGSVSALIDALNGVSVVGLDESSLQQVLGMTRQLRGALDALDFKVGAEADRLAVRGCSAPADELLANSGQLRPGTARRQATRSRVVAGIAGLSDAVGSGDVGRDHIDSLARRLTKLTSDERSKIDESRLVGKAKAMSADRFDKAVKDEVNRVRQDHGLKDAVQKRQASEFRHWFDHKTGMGKFSGQLDPERYEALTTAVDQHVNTLAASGKPTNSRESVAKDAALAAAALAELVCTSPKRSANVPHITVVVDHKTLVEGGHEKSIRQTGNGHDLPPETVARLCCDSTLQKVVLDQRGVPIDVGRKYRTATDAQWAAMRAIYSTCAWKNCDRPLSWCQLHHINEWNNGGSTNLDNLVPLCTTHHHRVHEGKWRIKLQPGRTLQIWKPNGQQIPESSGPPSRSKVPTPIDTARTDRAPHENGVDNERRVDSNVHGIVDPSAELSLYGQGSYCEDVVR